MVKRFLSSLAFLAALLLAPAIVSFSSTSATESLPARLSDQEFWKLASDYSELDGTFHSENLVSNEARYQTIIPELAQTAKSGRAYIGVGSEQNFSYIAALHPSVAFIIDIRRGNLDLHLIYKALFEMSTNRADFVSRLFSRKTPEGLSTSSTASEIFAAFRKAAADQMLYDQNLKQIKSHLMTKHGFSLSKGDLDGIDFVYGSWFKSGPDIRYELTGVDPIARGGSRGTSGFPGMGGSRGMGGPWGRGGPDGGFPTYADLMTATDKSGKNLSYLATESAFERVKDLESRNLIIPVVGNFSGPKALRAIGAWLKEHQVVVSTFYTSNVEQYLREDGTLGKFCSSAAVLPLDESSIFIRSARSGFRGQRAAAGPGFGLELVPMKPDLAACAKE
jgi:hypothetical protein